MKISVIICTYNRAASLHRALLSLISMYVPKDLPWEILVVDNNSNDDTKGCTVRFAQRADVPVDVRYVFEGRQGLNHARNAAIKAAVGDLLFYIDDDVEVTGNWLTEMKSAFDRYPVIGIGGKVLLKKNLQKPPWWRTEYDGALGKFDAGDSVILSDDSYTSIIGIGANLGFKRSAFDKHGLFRSDLDRRKNSLSMGGDVEFVQRVKNGGDLSMYYPGAVVYHCPVATRITKSYLRRWYFRIGEWQALKFPGKTSKPLLPFTVPRWKYGQMLAQLRQAVASFLTGRRDDGFYHELQCMSVLGYFFGAAKNWLVK
jgi:glycosyltransferase involved in cell wall biosynthesis